MLSARRTPDHRRRSRRKLDSGADRARRDTGAVRSLGTGSVEILGILHRANPESEHAAGLPGSDVAVCGLVRVSWDPFDEGRAGGGRGQRGGVHERAGAGERET